MFYVFVQELEISLDEERRSGEDARSAVTLLERKRIALQTELEDVRALLETVRVYTLSYAFLLLAIHIFIEDLVLYNNGLVTNVM
jgi:hypothetical protein